MFGQVMLSCQIFRFRTKSSHSPYRDERLDREVEYVPELAAVWRGVEVPLNPDELERELGKAGLAAAPRATDRKRTALPPKVRTDKGLNCIISCKRCAV